MLQVGSTVRIKEDAFKDSHDPLEFDLRGRIGTVKFELANAWEVQVDDEFFILDDTEFDEVEITEEITPDTPQNRRFAALIRSGIETLGWDEFEREFVDATGLILIKEEAGRRFYEWPDGQLKITIGNFVDES